MLAEVNVMMHCKVKGMKKGWKWDERRVEEVRKQRQSIGYEICRQQLLPMALPHQIITAYNVFFKLHVDVSISIQISPRYKKTLSSPGWK